MIIDWSLDHKFWGWGCLMLEHWDLNFILVQLTRLRSNQNNCMDNFHHLKKLISNQRLRNYEGRS